MKTCSGCPRRPAVTAHHARARKGPCGGLPRWKTSRSRRSRRIDVPRRTRDQATGKRARLGADPYPAPREMSEGSNRQRHPSAEKAGAPPPPARSACDVRQLAAAEERGGRRTRSRRRAVKREAVGGRMTARWSGAARSQKAKAPGRRRSRGRTSAGFPRRSAGSLRKRCFRRVLVT